MRAILLLLIGVLIGLFAYPLILPPGDAHVEPVFSPGAEDELIELIRGTNKTIDVELFEFSNVRLQDELIDADARGVRVRVILEARLEGQQNLQAAERLRRGGVEVRWGSLKFGRTHSKNAVFDERIVWVGSPNWSRNGMERNRESAVIVRNENVAKDFDRVFESDWLEAG